METLMHYQFPYQDSVIDGTMVEIERKVAAIVEDTTEEAIVRAVKEAAMANGVTDLYLLDQKFIMDAIREKKEREQPKTIADTIRAMSDEDLCDVIFQLSYAVDPGCWFCTNKKECREVMDADKEIPDEWCKDCLLARLREPVPATKPATMADEEKQHSGLIEED